MSSVSRASNRRASVMWQYSLRWLRSSVAVSPVACCQRDASSSHRGHGPDIGRKITHIESFGLKTDPDGLGAALTYGSRQIRCGPDDVERRLRRPVFDRVGVRTRSK